MNDVHLPRFGRGLSRRPRQYGVIRNSHPQSVVHHGDSKDFSPSNSWNDSKTSVLRQSPHPPELAHGVRHSAPKRKFRTAFANSVRNRAWCNHPKTTMPATLLDNESHDHQLWQANLAICNQRCNQFQDCGKVARRGLSPLGALDKKTRRRQLATPRFSRLDEPEDYSFGASSSRIVILNLTMTPCPRSIDGLYSPTSLRESSSSSWLRSILMPRLASMAARMSLTPTEP